MGSDLEYMQSKGGMAVGSLIVGILIGAVAGGIAALLFAPRSGQETRELFKTKASETQQMVQDRVRDVKDRVQKVRDNMKSKADEEVQKVDTAYHQGPV